MCCLLLIADTHLFLLINNPTVESSSNTNTDPEFKFDADDDDHDGPRAFVAPPRADGAPNLSEIDEEIMTTLGPEYEYQHQLPEPAQQTPPRKKNMKYLIL